jgi:DNA-directed RNA polymerase specialized sigma24 family protein
MTDKYSDPLSESGTRAQSGAEEEFPAWKDTCLSARGQDPNCGDCSLLTTGDCDDWCDLLTGLEKELRHKYPWLDDMQRDDILAETFVRCSKSIATFLRESTFKTWAKSIFKCCRKDHFDKSLGKKPRITLAEAPNGLGELCLRYGKELFFSPPTTSGTIRKTGTGLPESAAEELRALSWRKSWQFLVNRLVAKGEAKIPSLPKKHPQSASSPTRKFLDLDQIEAVCLKYNTALSFTIDPTQGGTLYLIRPPLSNDAMADLRKLAGTENWRHVVAELIKVNEEMPLWRPAFASTNLNDDGDDELPQHEAPSPVDPQTYQDERLERALNKSDIERLRAALADISPKCAELLRAREEHGGIKPLVLAKARDNGEELDQDELKTRCNNTTQEYGRCLDKLFNIFNKKRPKQPTGRLS